MRFSRPSRWCAALLAATMATPIGLLSAQAKPAPGAPSQAKPRPPKTPGDDRIAQDASCDRACQDHASGDGHSPARDQRRHRVAANHRAQQWHRDRYQPQIEAWTDQKKVVAYSAVSFLPTGKESALGTIKIEGDTAVSVDDRVVRLDLASPNTTSRRWRRTS